MRLNRVVDGERAALSQSLHGFLERDLGYYNMLGIVDKELIFLSKEGVGDKYNPNSNTNSDILLLAKQF